MSFLFSNALILSFVVMAVTAAEFLYLGNMAGGMDWDRAFSFLAKPFKWALTLQFSSAVAIDVAVLAVRVPESGLILPEDVSSMISLILLSVGVLAFVMAAFCLVVRADNKRCESAGLLRDETCAQKSPK